MPQHKEAIIFVAAPGAGKNTQAEKLAEQFGFFHFELSNILEQTIKNADPSDARMMEAKRLFDAGELLPSDMVLQIVIDLMHKKAEEGASIVFNGPFRKLNEAEQELPVLESLYDKEFIHIVSITISEAESVKRNVARRVCVNRHVIPDFEQYKDITVCPFDGAELKKRSLDTEEKARRRFAVYKEETEPVLAFFISKGYRIITVHGEDSIEAVHANIVRELKL
jgi:adenylate kinase